MSTEENAGPARSSRPGPKRERRRHARQPIRLAASIIGPSREELAITLLNLSRGGTLISASGALKSLAFKRERYAHKPLLSLLVIEGRGTVETQLLLGRCIHLRKLAEDDYRAGFKFSQLQPQGWVDALVWEYGRLTQLPRHPRDYEPVLAG
jgi:c-di-GMP-binding flagellar brake protein YcgR